MREMLSAIKVKLCGYINRLLAEVGKRGKGERFVIFPFPFNLFPLTTRVQKELLLIGLMSV
jgi:hypothetical protein